MTNPKALLKYWMNERQNVQYLKDVEAPKPWSDDPIFQTTYFTNVHREDDKVTKWIRKWVQEEKTIISNGKQIIFNLIMARLVNKPETLDFIGWWNKFDRIMWDGILDEIPRSQGAIWGSAYIVSTCGQKIPKAEYMGYLLEDIQETLNRWEKSGQVIRTCEEAHTFLLTIRGLSDFMAAQVVADIKHTPGMSLTTAPDFYTFAKPGPGSMRGLAWYFGVDKVTPKDFKPLIQAVFMDLGLDEDFEMQDLQNCLCEFDKYMRIKNGTGRSKRKYPGI